MSRTMMLALGGVAVALSTAGVEAGTHLSGRTSLVAQSVPASFAGVFASDERPAGRPVRLAQAGSDILVRVDQLEEEVRKLTGQVEDLRFQLLQAQEDMRKKQEDYEYRFQQLEGGSSASQGASSTGGSSSSSSAPSGQRSDNGSGTNSASTETGTGTGGGNASSDDIGKIVAGADQGGSSGGDENAASATPKGASDLYDRGYNYLLAGDYGQAERTFRQYAQTYPKSKDTPDARYWLGESLYQQQKYADAAETFLDAQKASPNSGRAPEMMLKLGMSLAKLDNRDVACTTYREAEKRYPKMGEKVRTKLKAEEKASSC